VSRLRLARMALRTAAVVAHDPGGRLAATSDTGETRGLERRRVFTVVLSLTTGGVVRGAARRPESGAFG
jgi:hypothetical protein